MAIGILYESDEWSSYQLLDEVQALGVEATLLDAAKPISTATLLSFDLIVNRVFASAIFRHNHYALAQMPTIIGLLEQQGIPMINPYQAHFYEISKARSTAALAHHGIAVPVVYGVFDRQELQQTNRLQYPCIVKPDCGGRTNSTYILHSRDQLQAAMQTAPDIRYIAEEYILPQYGYLTRIEVIGGACRLILKRSVTEGGLSAYHLGSIYTRYDDCADIIKDTAIRAMDLLSIESGSMDVIENDTGFYIIDVNSVSNASEDNTETFGFDLMKETAAYVVGQYERLAVMAAVQ